MDPMVDRLHALVEEVRAHLSRCGQAMDFEYDHVRLRELLNEIDAIMAGRLIEKADKR